MRGGKKFVLLFIVSCVAMYICAQSDPFLLRIHGEEITRSGFEDAYNAQRTSAIHNKKDIHNYLQQFIDRKLKIAEANSLKLDTTSGYRLALSNYKKEINLTFAVPGNDVLWRQYRKEQKELPLPGRVRVMQIIKLMPQSYSSLKQEETWQLMNDLYARLSADPQADFAEYVERYSDDKRCLDMGWLESHPDFERIVFSMRSGEISKPFLTPLGAHIIKVIDKKDVPADDELEESFQARTLKRYKSGKEQLFLRQLKDELNYIPNTNRIEELLAMGHTTGVLFTLNNKEYTVDDFYFFAKGNPKGVKRQFNDFVVKMLFDSRQSQTTRPDVDKLLDDFKEQYLLAEVTRREVTDKIDKAGLIAYFSVYKKKYRWKPPRFKGVVLYARDKKLGRSAKKLVKKMPFKEWQKLITQYFNTGPVPQVEAEQGLFALGDNAVVDELVFKSGRATPSPSYPFIFVIGKKVKGPEYYEEIMDLLVADYEQFLEERWLARLRDTYRVEINEEIFKQLY